MKKIMCFVVTMIMAFSLCVPAFALNTPYSVDSESNLLALETFCDRYDVSDSDIQKMVDAYPDGVSQLKMLEQQAEAYDFTAQQVNDYISGMINVDPSVYEGVYGTLSDDGTTFILPNGDTMPNLSYNKNPEPEDEYGITPYAFTSSYKDVTSANDQSGVYWNVVSNTGYNQATAFFKLPTVTATTTAPDRPYMFYSVNTTSSSVCGDYGVVYYPSSRSWYLCANTKVWNSSTNSYDNVWWQSKAPLPNEYYSGAKSLYLHILIDNTTSKDTVTVTVKDGTSFATLATHPVDFSGNPFNASLSNVKIYRSITMAQDLAPNGLLNTSTGTRAVNSIFSQAYIYSPSGYYTWGTSQTSTAERRAPYQRQLNTITVNSYTKWNSENISIMFNQ